MGIQTKYFLLSVAVVLACGGARAERAAVRIEHLGVTTTGCAVAVTEGWTFRVGEAVRVVALGVWDRGGDGLVEPHAVGLWDESGETLATATVPAATDTRLIDGFRYLAIQPVALQAGKSYVIGAFYGTPLRDPHIDGGSNNRISTDPQVTWIERRRKIAPELEVPTDTSQANRDAGAFGPNFLLDSEPPQVVHQVVTAANRVEVQTGPCRRPRFARLRRIVCRGK